MTLLRRLTCGACRRGRHEPPSLASGTRCACCGAPLREPELTTFERWTPFLMALAAVALILWAASR